MNEQEILEQEQQTGGDTPPGPTSDAQTQTDLTPQEMSDTLEFHAERQHQIWAHWMEYQFGICQEQPDGSLIIPAEKVAHWNRQLATPYDELSETERESDRQVVREYLSEVL